MKKRMYFFIALFAGASGLYAQDCAKGYCPSTIVVHHIKGDLSAATTDITYNVMKSTVGASSCWITQNLGAPSSPTAYTDYGSSYAGWQYQVNRKKAYVQGSYTGFSTTALPPTSGTTWSPSDDPCTLTFGSAWRLPTQSEGVAVASGTTWTLAGKWNTLGTEYYDGSAWQWMTTQGGSAGYMTSNAWNGVSSSMSLLLSNYGSNGITAWTPSVTTYGSAMCSVRCMKLIAD